MRGRLPGHSGPPDCIAAILANDLHVRLHNACGRDYAISIVRSLANTKEIRQGWLFVDPAVVDADQLLALCGMGVVEVSRVILYTRVSTPAVARSIAKLSLGGVSCLVLADIEDSPDGLRRPLHSAPLADARLEVVGQLASSLLEAPPRLALALTQEFLGLTSGAASKQLAAAVGMHRRSVERWFRRIDLAPPKIALSAAHLVRAFPVLKDPSVPLYVVAREYGFSSVRTLTRQCKLVFGLSPHAVRAFVRPEDLPILIPRRLNRHARRSAADLRLSARCRKMACD
jgi:AraC-like DNA-binding protein